MLEDVAGWVAPAATMIAAMMTAANLGARITGWGFVVFTLGSLAWIVVAVASGQQNLLAANAFLTVVNLVGIWRWLGRQARYYDGGKAAADRSAAAAAPTLFPLSGLMGWPVVDAGGTTIGGVVDAMAACEGGAIAYLVVREGGVGGVGERLHALGWAEVAVHDDHVTTRLTAGQLRDRLELQPDRWPATAEAAGVG